jgi:1,2-diacylglycerol 3-beta-glucosyltransferase
MIGLIDSVLGLAGLVLLAMTGYLAVLTFVWRRPPAAADARCSTRFRILVPAHDEERGIASTIRSLQAVDYPRSNFDIVVVADNCTDRTAEVAAAAGAQVIARTDEARRGKGWALRHAIDRLLVPAAGSGPEWDALVVVDADTVVSDNLLRSLAAKFEAGAQAVQVAYLPRRGGRGPLAVITEVALTAFHLVRSGARERLGLSCGLRGNGMAFCRALLRDVPHDAFSRTEDLEFGVMLGLRGVRVVFAGDTTVYGEMPTDHRVAGRQRERWIGGRTAMARRFVPGLVGDALRRRSAVSADLAMDLVVPPISTLAVALVCGAAASVLAAFVAGQFTVSLAVWVAAAACLAIHVLHAARLAGQGAAFGAVAWAVPAYALRKTGIALRAIRPSEETWVRTTREGELP